MNFKNRIKILIADGILYSIFMMIVKIYVFTFHNNNKIVKIKKLLALKIIHVYA